MLMSSAMKHETVILMDKMQDNISWKLVKMKEDGQIAVLISPKSRLKDTLILTQIFNIDLVLVQLMQKEWPETNILMLDTNKKIEPLKFLSGMQYGLVVILELNILSHQTIQIQLAGHQLQQPQK